MTKAIEIRLNQSYKICKEKIKLISIPVEMTNKIPRNSKIIINSVQSKAELLNLLYILKHHLLSSPIIILTSSKSIRTIIENLNKPNISIIYISKNEEKITTIKPKKTAAIPSKLEYRIKEFKSYCLNQEKNNRSVYFQDLFKYFPECEKKAISKHSTIPSHIFHKKLEKLIALMLNSKPSNL